MNRIRELCREYLSGAISARAFRSSLIAQMSMMTSPVETDELAKLILGVKK